MGLLSADTLTDQVTRGLGLTLEKALGFRSAAVLARQVRRSLLLEVAERLLDVWSRRRT
jgi:hypothetical protein